MRITNNLLVRGQLAGLQANAQAVEKAQRRVTTGLRVSRMSDDPTGGVGVMQSASGLRAIGQYRRNVVQAQSRIDVQDQVLQQVTDLLTRAKELGMAQGDGRANAQTRATANKELEEIFKQIVSLGGARLGDEFVFGGETADADPLAVSGSGATLDFTESGGVGARSIEVGEGRRFTATHDARTLFVDSGVLGAMRDLARATVPGGAPDPEAAVRASLVSLDRAFESVQALIGETGARANSLQMTASNLDAF
jgi:flagellar hook-associated protein 3 FlgL